MYSGKNIHNVVFRHYDYLMLLFIYVKAETYLCQLDSLVIIILEMIIITFGCQLNVSIIFHAVLLPVFLYLERGT